ncbi:MAG: hypothetical protein ACOYI6_00755 [Christensenellales bacterium]|jgi:hypothetical protein|nr:hypothetical protein [Clostridiales bacterium]
MRAKILFLAEKPVLREGLRLAQEMLSEMAVAFSHSFIMREHLMDREFSPQELRDLSSDHDAVVLAGSQEFSDKAAKALSCFAGMSAFNRADTVSELSRLKEGSIPSADFIWPLAGDTAIISKTAVTACAHAKKLRKNVVLSLNEGTQEWVDPLNKAAMYAALPAPAILPLHEAMDTLLFQQDRPSVVLANSDEKNMLSSLMRFLTGTELLQHTSYYSDHIKLHSVIPPAGQQGFPLFSALYAAASAVRESLLLEKEADCLDTAIANVLASSWRTPEFGVWPKTISHEEALRLIVEQVHLAGELMENFN